MKTENRLNVVLGAAAATGALGFCMLIFAGIFGSKPALYAACLLGAGCWALSYMWKCARFDQSCREARAFGRSISRSVPVDKVSINGITLTAEERETLCWALDIYAKQQRPYANMPDEIAEAHRVIDNINKLVRIIRTPLS